MYIAGQIEHAETRDAAKATLFSASTFRWTSCSPTLSRSWLFAPGARNQTEAPGMRWEKVLEFLQRHSRASPSLANRQQQPSINQQFQTSTFERHSTIWRLSLPVTPHSHSELIDLGSEPLIKNKNAPGAGSAVTLIVIKQQHSSLPAVYLISARINTATEFEYL